MHSLAPRCAFVGLALLTTLASFTLALRGNVQHQSFKAFYCAGAAVRERSDPYRVEPLRSCERQLEVVPIAPGYVEPAPLPGYAFAPFALLSTLPPRAAAVLFAVALSLASILCALCVATLIEAPAFAVLLAFVPLTLLNVSYGEIAPFATLAVGASAYLLGKGRWTAAGIAISLALIQPNVGLPAVLAVFFFAPRARMAIAVSCASLAALSLATLGFDRNVEYFSNVLPSLANAELRAADQYGLPRLLYIMGASPSVALLIGKVWFGFAAIVGVLLAGRLSAKTGRPEWLAVLPCAAVLFFGIYLHDVQLIVALPAALVIAAWAPRPLIGAIGATSLALLIAVWTQPAGRALLVIDCLGVFGGLVAVLRGSVNRRLRIAAVAAVATAIGLILIQHAVHPLTADHIVTHSFDALPNEFAPIAWARYLQATPALSRTVLAPQVVAWLALLGLLAGAFATMRGQCGSRGRPLATEQCSGSLQKCG